jgi:plastocyanin domain-containing protein
MKMKNTMIIAIVIVLIIGFGIFLIKDSRAAGNSAIGADKIQKVTLSFKNGNYYPQIVNVKVNETVRIYLDSSITGCYRTFTINELSVIKNIETPADYVEFTPTQKGTYRFACIMGMGTGTLIVE